MQINNRQGFVRAETSLSEWFRTVAAPAMDAADKELRTKQVEEMKRYDRSFAGVMASLSDGAFPSTADTTRIKLTGEWNSKTTDDYLEMCRRRMSDGDGLRDVVVSWRKAMVTEVGAERYAQLSEALGTDLADAFVRHRIDAMMMDRLVKQNVPKSSAEYIITKIGETSLFGLNQTLSRTQTDSEIAARAEQEYGPSFKEKAAGVIGGSVVDAVSLGGAGSWSALAKFVGIDAAMAAAGSLLSGDPAKDEVELQVSKALFDSDQNVFNGFRKEASRKIVDLKPTESGYLWDGANDGTKVSAKDRTAHLAAGIQGPMAPGSNSPLWTPPEKIKTEVTVPFAAETNVASEANGSKSKSKADVSWIDGKADFTSLSSLPKAEEENGSAVEQKIGEQAGQAAVLSQQSSYQTAKVADPLPVHTADAQVPHQADPQPYTLQSGWDSLLSSTGLKGLTDVTENLGYVLTQLPDLLVGLLTGKRTANLSENMLPIAAIMAGMFVKSPMLKALLIGIGGANLLNKAGHAALGMEGWTTDRTNAAATYPYLRSGNAINASSTVNYKVYPQEELNERITDPVLKGGCLIATIDHVPCTVQLPQTVIDAYHEGALPLNTLANAVLAKNDELRQTAARNYENDTPETLVRTRGIQ